MLPLKLSEDNKIAIFDFVKSGKKLVDAPTCGMSLLAAGSMRFRWNETNPLRDDFLGSIAMDSKVTPVELIHSKIVIDAKSVEDTKNIQADGIITKNPKLMPVITVADCMPLFLYDSKEKVFGVVHSGWKGTGIIKEAIELSCKNYGSKIENFSVIIGPHIHSCCYIVNQERADFFASEFTPDCVTELEPNGKCYAGGRGLPVSWNNGGGKLYRLSLEKANLACLEQIGVPSENINIIDECTCCNKIFGSNRRETAEWTAAHPDAQQGIIPPFTVQVVFIKC